MASVRLFPVDIRFTAFALPASIGTALFGSTTPYVSTWLTVATGNLLAPGFYMLAVAAVSTAATLVALPRIVRTSVTVTPIRTTAAFTMKETADV